MKAVLMVNALINKASLFFKAMAKVTGGLFISYGVIVGLIGWGPDGPTISIGWRAIGVLCIVQGLLYFVPNNWLSTNHFYFWPYLITTILPALFLLGATFFTVYNENWDAFTRSGGLITVAVLIPLSLLSPLSLIFFRIEKKESGGS